MEPYQRPLDQTDADNYWIMRENRKLRAQATRLREAIETIHADAMLPASYPAGARRAQLVALVNQIGLDLRDTAPEEK
jgi:hypothetical protein